MSISKFVEPGKFDPEVYAAMSAAFDDACKEINYPGARVVFEVIAERIVVAARNGERDPVRLRAAALAGIPHREE